jgi:hypothetical protein
MTPPEVGGVPAGDVGVAVFGEATEAEAARGAELSVVALFVGAPAPTAPAGAPPPTLQPALRNVPVLAGASLLAARKRKQLRYKPNE